MSELDDRLAALHSRLSEALRDANDARALDDLRVAYLGRSGEVTTIRRAIGTLPVEERPTAGKTINAAVEQMEALFTDAESRLRMKALDAELASAIDVTLAPPPSRLGSLHPVRMTIEAVATYFERYGFAVVLGPQIDTEYYAFDALNIPATHPARENLDSFFLGMERVLRPHTSNMQIHAMEAHPAPIATLSPGVAYRRDAIDARHLYQFHQIEGLCVGTGIHMGHLKGMLEGMCRELFGPEQKVRFRPSYFPFTEPSAEVDTTCPACHGNGGVCRTCGGSGWIEIGGSGMVHPNVLRAVGYDPDVVGGWAFGCGVERLAMVRYGTEDIRAYVSPDLGTLELFH